MEYPKCSNSSCKYNDQYLCISNGLHEDIVCQQGKADAIKKAKCSKSENKRLTS